MQRFEVEYAELIQDILANGTKKQTRNGETKSLFGMSLEVDMQTQAFPLIQGRKMYPNGVLGELAAMLRKPTCVEDFEKWGCNYWKLWADDTGQLAVDYGNSWFDFEGFDQIADLKNKLKFHPDDRRMIINSWRPHKLDTLSLPCCHYSYQFYVANNTISMIWTQRSVDMLIGLPSDIIFAAAWLIMIANEFGFKLGKIKMDLGDCHVYEEHYTGAYEYIYRVLRAQYSFDAPMYKLYAPRGKDFCKFEPSDIALLDSESLSAIDFKLKE